MKAEPLMVSPPDETRSFGAVVRDYVALTKPRLSALVLFTAAPGMWLSGRTVDWKTFLFAMLGTAGTVGAANTINCVIERESDRFMARTAKRPLPSQRLESKHALVFALVLGLVSLPMLALGVNWLTGALGALALGSYAFVYTPLKSRTRWAMQVGAFPGALPPLMGWTAATGRIELPGLVLFGILFFWQLPHFIAIALFRKAEYQAAGLTSLPLEKGDDTARRHAVGYIVLLLPVSVAPYFVGVAGGVYLAVACVLGVGFLAVGVQGWVRKLGDGWARRLFLTSLVYLTVLFAALGLDAR
ncbi:MAG: heme o synthase [Archangium sp.]|nr:heme o synthase [Archangium sp.]